MLKPLTSAVILTVCAVGLAAPAQAQGGYIVIAGSDSAHAVEVTVGGSHAGLSDVEARAIGHCAERYGATDCHVLAEGRGGCVALSDNGHGLVGGWGPTRNAAGAAAAAKVVSGQPNVDGTRCVVDPDLVSSGSFSFVATQ
ncbi:hypothetical protein HMPREF0591_0628 [Mycobacterium parascrofulaceum ATCC BAA-614]|uniref:Uncharacterized protein n=1 Tax=Mycobacterium parascrofulaceum ATCC BAA-614 TaxID=525368 RepID=D5P384_9MYCO|nr:MULTISPECIES: DUF4189 domain-containing protein [Mycobacterium]EFG79478.1 hypothetical protein HMPREF0591_0628 [Mycobacterium parascrofulaceum ATCC BAA-614]OCB27450.1 DUF4189 domain-containing protein [Mycobacterium malmoense]